MTTPILALAILATTALPPPPGVRSSAPALQEQLGRVQPLLSFDGTYDIPFAEARVRFEGHVRAHGWRVERTLVLGQRQGVVSDLALSYTNRSDRLTALLSGVRLRQTSLKYQIEPKTSGKTSRL